jgi:aldose 1-epimerase
MPIQRTEVGTTHGHPAQPPTPVHAYTLSAGGGVTATVWTYGATLTQVLAPDRAGRRANVTVRLPDLASYQDRRRNPYVGAVLGRYCRCVSGGEFGLDGASYRLDRNDGGHHLHGGSVGLDRFVWDAEASRDGDGAAVRLRITRPDGDQGYPGELSAAVTYRVLADGRLILDYRATTTAATIVGLTSHAFWNLAGRGVLRGHRLAINAHRGVLLGGDLLPRPGPPGDIAGTGLDYRAGRALAGQRIDNFFVLDDPGWAAELHDPVSGRHLRVVTDQPGLGVYTGDLLSPSQAGLCLQASAWPDAPNRPDFPSCRLDPGQVYRHHTEHHFTVAT